MSIFGNLDIISENQFDVYRAAIGKYAPSLARTKNLCNDILVSTYAQSEGVDASTIRTFAPNTYRKGFVSDGTHNEDTINVNFLSDRVEVKYSYFGYGLGFPIRLPKGETVTASLVGATSENFSFYWAFYDNDGKHIGQEHGKQTVLIPNNCEWTVVIVSGNPNDGWVSFVGLQIELGTVATEYEPYLDLSRIEFGKNLFDKKRAADPNNWSIVDTNYYYCLPIYVGAGNTVTISHYNKLNGGIDLYVCFTLEKQYDGNDNKYWYYHDTIPEYYNLVTTITAIEDYIYCWCYTPNITTGDFTKYLGNYLQIEYGTEATPYVPYISFDSEDVNKNLLDESYISITAGGYRYHLDNELLFKGGQTYTLKTYCPYRPDGLYIYVNDVDVFGAYGTGILTFTFDEDTLGHIRVYWSDDGNIPSIEKLHTKLEEGSVATSYVNYGGVKENLFDISKVQTLGPVVNNGDGSLSVSNYGVGVPNGTLIDFCPDLVAGHVYTFSMITDGVTIIYLGQACVPWSIGTSKILTENMLNSDVYFYNDASGSSKVCTLKNIKIEEGSEATEYRPYGYSLDDRLVIIAQNQEKIYDASVRRYATKNITDKADFVSAPDSAGYKFLDFGMEGNTEQETTSGEQLFDISKLNITYLGGSDADITEIGENYIVITTTERHTGNGYTNTGHMLKEVCPGLVVGETYTLSANSQSNKGNMIWIDTSWYFGKSITITEEMLNANVVFYGYNYMQGEAPGSCKISDITIVKGTTPGTWEPYTGGKASPNPEYQQEIVNAGKIGNLFDIDSWVDGIEYNKPTLTSGECYLPAVSDFSVWIENNWIPFTGKKNTQYTWSCDLKCGTATMFGICFIYSDGTTTFSDRQTNSDWRSVSVTSEDGKNVVALGLSYGAAGTGYIRDFMITEGPEIKPYKPYTGRYEIESSVGNKNLFDKESIIRAYENGDYISGSYSIVNLKGFKPNTTYYAKCYGFGSNFTGLISSHEKINSSITNTITVTTYGANVGWPTQNAITTGDDGLIRIGVNTANISDIISILNDIEVQIEESPAATDFTPHKSKQFTLTSPQPLTKWDKLVKRDGIWGWSVYSVKLVVDGDVIWRLYDGKHGFMAEILPSVINDKDGYCNQLTLAKLSNWSGKDSIRIGYNNKFLQVLYSSLYDESLEDKGLANWKAHLNENPLEIWTYADTEQTFYPLPDDEQKMLKKLETYYGGTNAYNDQGCPMWFEYVVDPETL